MPSNADYLAMVGRHEPPPPEDESTNEQQGGLQTLKSGLWEHYGRQHVAEIVRLQRAFRRCIAKKDLEQRKFDAFFDTKFRQLYSVDAQDAFQARLAKRLQSTHLLPSVKIDSRHLELARGLSLHRAQLLSFLATAGPDHVTEGRADEPAAELVRLKAAKIFEDLNHRFASELARLNRERTVERR